MKSPQSIQISIPNPCSQNWDKMAPSGNGRHCAHCSTTVIDFTTWTDADLYNFFAKREEHVCGRYLSTQLNRPIHIPPQPHSRLYRMVVAMGLMLIFGGVVEARAQSKVLVQETVQKSRQPNTNTIGIIGTVTDANNMPVTGAVVGAYINGVLKGKALTDIDGNYSIVPLPNGSYKVTIGRSGYAYRKYYVTISDSVIKCNTVLNPPVSYKPRQRIIMGGRKSF